MKNCKIFYENQTASHLIEIIQPPPTPPPYHQKKSCYVFERKIFLERYKEICRHFAFKVLQESSSWASGNGALQMFFLTPNRNMFTGKFVN